MDRLNGAVSQFLDYAKPYTLNLKPQRIEPVVEKAISLIRASRLSEAVAIETEFHPDLPLANIDAEQMIQVILNIAINAIDAMPEGGSLNFRTTRIEGDDGGAIALSIRDTGRGIAKEDMKNIFKPFSPPRKGVSVLVWPSAIGSSESMAGSSGSNQSLVRAASFTSGSAL